MVITRHDDGIENCGCVWAGNNALHHDTVSDIVRWAVDCENCEDETSYVEPSGFIYHLDKSLKKKLGIPNSSFLENFATTSAHTVSTVAKESISQLADLVHISTFGFFGSSKRVSQSPEGSNDTGPSDDLAESRFLVGLEGELEEDENENTAEVFASDTDLYSEMLSPEDTGDRKINLSYKKLFLRLENEQRNESPSSSDSDSKNLFEFEQCSVVVYRRRPFVFTLLYKSKSPALSDKTYYQSLHRRLASLSEPIYTDLTSEGHESSISDTSSRPAESGRPRGNSRARPRSASTVLAKARYNSKASGSSQEFYYHAYDPNKHKVQYSLPEIPPLEYIMQLEQEANDDGATAQQADFDRLELIHVHLNMAHISFTCSHKGDKEKVIRTARGWWVYWSRLSDGRQIVFARKWNRPGKPPLGSASNGLLGVLGKDAKVWLDDYTNFGKV